MCCANNAEACCRRSMRKHCVLLFKCGVLGFSLEKEFEMNGTKLSPFNPL